MPLKASFYPIKTANPLPRSSHALSFAGQRIHIFGGEIEPRKPVDNVLHSYQLPSAGVISSQPWEYVTKADSDGDSSERPPPRVGHTAVSVGPLVLVFGGRGGKDMTALEEKGR
ncbi:hypothetical protein LTR66_010730, partial [Elasticomyces elasticus]